MCGMPEVYKKFRDSQGLASISRALKASQAARVRSFAHWGVRTLSEVRVHFSNDQIRSQEADPPGEGKEETRPAEAREEAKSM